jgi:hypothetical protein
MKNLEVQHLRIGLGVAAWIIMVALSQETVAAMGTQPLEHALLHAAVSAGLQQVSGARPCHGIPVPSH